MEKPADMSSLRSSGSMARMVFRRVNLRGIMVFPLGDCPDEARTILDLRMASGWPRAEPWVAATGALPRPGVLLQIPLHHNENGVPSPVFWHLYSVSSRSFTGPEPAETTWRKAKLNTTPRWRGIPLRGFPAVSPSHPWICRELGVRRVAVKLSEKS
jgi:hypothetical protein